MSCQSAPEPNHQIIHRPDRGGNIKPSKRAGFVAEYNPLWKVQTSVVLLSFQFFS
ncbi:unnamed protein product, partial [Staurois parvus]